jgi:hypothetical protein
MQYQLHMIDEWPGVCDDYAPGPYLVDFVVEDLLYMAGLA